MLVRYNEWLRSGFKHESNPTAQIERRAGVKNASNIEKIGSANNLLFRRVNK